MSYRQTVTPVYGVNGQAVGLSSMHTGLQHYLLTLEINIDVECFGLIRDLSRAPWPKLCLSRVLWFKL